MHLDFLWRYDAELDLFVLAFEDSNLYFIPNRYALSLFSSQYQHGLPLKKQQSYRI